MTVRRLTGPEIGHLSRLLGAAFEPEDFDALLQDHLDRRVREFAAASDRYPIVLRRVVTQANARLWWPELLAAALAEVPDPDLMEFASTHSVGARVHDAAVGPDAMLLGRRLELKIEESGHETVDVLAWRDRLTDLESRVCRVECPRAVGRGTAFLVGTGVVITNHHVVRDVITKERPRSDMVFRFDFKRLADRVTVNHGTEYTLADDWLIDSSDSSPGDDMVTPLREPEHQELDYALLSLAGPTSDFIQRGWISIPQGNTSIVADGAFHILEHPDGNPLQLALHTKSIIGLNGNGTRVRHRTTTQPGSSGSPCFNGNLDLVAMHQAGDPIYYKGQRPTYNQGIPITKIRDLLRTRANDAVLGA